MNDKSRLFNELSSSIETISPEIDSSKLTDRVEEILASYNISRKTTTEMIKDLSEKIEFFLSAIKLEGFSKLTIHDYRLELNLFRRFINKPTVQITTFDIRAYLSSYEGLMQSTLGKKLFVLRSFFNWLVKEEYLLKNPTLRIKPPKTPSRINKGLTIAELEKVRESCKTLRQRAIIEVGYSTAARLSELVGMNISHINYQDMSLSVIGKGDKERTVFLSPRAMYHLQKYLKSRDDSCDALFATVRQPYRRMTGGAIQREIKKIEEMSNIKSRLTAHRLRHTFGFLAMEQGIELADLQSLLGYSDPSTTLVYGSASEERKRQAFNRFHVL